MHNNSRSKNQDLERLLQDYCPTHPVLDTPFSRRNYLELDFTEGNKEILNLDLQNTESFNRYIFDTLKAAGAKVGYGGYKENRIIYKRSDHFQAEEPRSVHLGIDLWTEAGTPVFAPIDAFVHSFADNMGMGNYGPTIILGHNIGAVTFYTLYGHLSRNSLLNLSIGKKFKKGEKIGDLGKYPENGDWPPHLHFQIITDLMGASGDFPGVAKPSEGEQYLSICPDPNLILKYPR